MPWRVGFVVLGVLACRRGDLIFWGTPPSPPAPQDRAALLIRQETQMNVRWNCAPAEAQSTRGNGFSDVDCELQKTSGDRLMGGWELASVQIEKRDGAASTEITFGKGLEYFCDANGFCRTHLPIGFAEIWNVGGIRPRFAGESIFLNDRQLAFIVDTEFTLEARRHDARAVQWSIRPPRLRDGTGQCLGTEVLAATECRELDEKEERLFLGTASTEACLELDGLPIDANMCRKVGPRFRIVPREGACGPWSAQEVAGIKTKNGCVIVERLDI